MPDNHDKWNCTGQIVIVAIKEFDNTVKHSFHFEWKSCKRETDQVWNISKDRYKLSEGADISYLGCGLSLILICSVATEL